MRALRLCLLAATLATAPGHLSCGASGEEACEEMAATLRVFFRARCSPLVAQMLIENLDAMMACPDVVGVRDDTALREECLPAIPSMECSERMQWPASCTGQFFYGGPSLF